MKLLFFLLKIFFQKRDGVLKNRTVIEEITSRYDDLGMRCERDAFDTLFDHAPEKLEVVKKVYIILNIFSFYLTILSFFSHWSHL